MPVYVLFPKLGDKIPTQVSYVPRMMGHMSGVSEFNLVTYRFSGHSLARMMMHSLLVSLQQKRGNLEKNTTELKHLYYAVCLNREVVNRKIQAELDGDVPVTESVIRKPFEGPSKRK